MTERETRTAGDGTLMLVVKGLLIGVANIIPGVSGGTFALVLGLFDRMISALHAVGLRTLEIVLDLVGKGFGAEARAAFVAEWKRVDGWFLIRVLIGALVAIFACGEFMKWLLANHPGVTLSFFLGLIIPSLAVPWGMMHKRSITQLLWVLPGIALTVGLSLAFSEQRGAQGHSLAAELAIAAGSGAVAVSAMVLPGISGSFVMLVVGQYQKVLEHLSAARTFDGFSILWLAALGIGCVLGLLLFSRLLHWLLHRWRSATMAFLIGLVLGSFFVLWPFKEFSAGGKVVGRSGEVKRDVQIATAPNRLPVSWTETGWNGLALLLGLAGAVGVEFVGRRSRERTGKDVDTSAECVGE